MYTCVQIVNHNTHLHANAIGKTYGLLKHTLTCGYMWSIKTHLHVGTYGQLKVMLVIVREQNENLVSDVYRTHHVVEVRDLHNREPKARG